MVQVGWVKQCHQDVYVKQRDHVPSRCLRFVSDPVDGFRRDDPGPLLLGQERHSVAFARGAISMLPARAAGAAQIEYAAP